MLSSLIYILFIATSVVKSISADGEPCKTAIYGFGVCVKINNCTVIERQLAKSQSANLLSAINCGQGNHMVCCPPQVSSHTNSHLLTRNICGVPQGPPHDQRVARVNEFPWTALLVYDSDSRPYQCAGSIITERYVLTAATCVTHELRRVRVGEHTRSTVRDCQFYEYTGVQYCAPNHQEFDIARSIRHQYYESSNMDHNIALIRLSGSIDLTQANVMPICLPLDQSVRAISLDTYTVTLAGWPLVEKYDKADSLHKIRVTVISNEECEARYRMARLASFLSGQEMMCAAGSEPYPCRGYEGGPLALSVVLGGRLRYVQCGIASHGAASCNDGLPEVYVRVASYIEWILHNLQP